MFDANPLAVWRAYRHGLRMQQKFQRLTAAGYLPHEAIAGLDQDDTVKGDKAAGRGLNIALIGHGYNLYDSYISMNIIQKLRSQGAAVLTADNLPADEIEDSAARLPSTITRG